MDPRRLVEVVRHGLSLPHDNLHFGLNGQVFDMDELVESLVRAYLGAVKENERLKGCERSVDAYMEATKNYQRSLQIEQAKVEELEEEMRGYKVQVAVARDNYRSLASGGFGRVSLSKYWREQADRLDRLLEREGPDLQRRSDD